MKKILTLTGIATILLVACQSKTTSTADIIASSDLKEIKAKRISLLAEIQSLETAISKLDTVKKLALVSTSKIKATDFYHTFEVQGNVETKQNILIQPEFSGNLKELLVKEGQKVTKGQIIAIIDDAGLKSQLAQAQASADLSQTTFDRQKRLWDQKIGSEIQFLQSKANYLAGKNQVAQLQAQLDKVNVRAPFSGVIDEIITEEGSLVSPGTTPIARIVNLNNMTITAQIPETYITSVNEGKMVKAFFPVLNTSTETKITQAGNFINPASRNFRVEMNVPKNVDAKPNMTVKLHINDYHNEKAFLIPQSIISENEDNKEYIYTIQRKGKSAIAKRTFVEIGKTQGDEIEILSGLSAGDEIIVEGARSVKDNQEVSIIK
ncbi:RND family efflux transporter MFP subunit [Wenyingzhuangia heitensis]|uniref:RND family efflux transporter MFP subunit n=1 Tax=Wenyingzhuangia heitensis TaxID=1487859 RepID=A0ABX0U6N4_9FLAO|nr:efflux RND transporter periplasmic adaptor subunit [Wenyingzhuangia heitensis]NIJ44423.1 RND family efflux transporter MFP subunit [Wenyingzhuangia heitensis]